MKVIFLDIDGVVTSARGNGFRDFDLHVVHWLRFICEHAPAQIVLSSTWRHSHDKEFWRTIFGDVIHDDWRTVDGRRKNESGLWTSPIRGDEIAEWLAGHPECDQYAILDDDADMRPEQTEHLIKTDAHNGMLFESFMALREKFDVNVFPEYDAEIYQHPNMFGTTRIRNSVAKQ